MATLLLLFAVPVACLAFSSEIAAFTDLPKRLWLQGATGLALIAFALRGDLPRRMSFEAAVLLAFTGTVAIGWWRGPEVFPATQTALHWGFCGVAFALVACDADERTPARLLWAIGGSGVAVAAIGLVQHFGWAELAPETTPPASTFGNRNWAAQVLVVALPACLFGWASSRAALGRWGFALGAGAVAGLLAKILSLATVVGVGVMTAAAALLVVRGVRARAGLGGALAGVARAGGASLVAGVLFSAALALYEPAGRPGILDSWRSEVSRIPIALAERDQVVKHSNLSDRWALYRMTSGMALETPWLGGGLGSFPVRLPAANRDAGGVLHIGFGGSFEHTHNDWLQIASELGVPSLLLLAVLGLAVAARAWRLAGADPGDFDPAVAGPRLVAAVMLLGSATHASFSFPLHNAVPPFLAAMLLGTLLPFETSAREGRQQPLRIAAAAIVVLGLAGWGARSLAVWRSDHHMARVHGGVATRDWQAVERHAEAVEALATGRNDYLLPLAQARIHAHDLEAAAALLDRRRAARPDDPVALALQGSIAQQRGDLEAAADGYRRAREIAPGEARVFAAEAAIRAALGDRAGAAAVLDLGLRHNPRDVELNRRRSALSGNAADPG